MTDFLVELRPLCEVIELKSSRRRRGSKPSQNKKKLKLPNLSKLFKDWTRGLRDKASSLFIRRVILNKMEREMNVSKNYVRSIEVQNNSICDRLEEIEDNW